MALSVYTVVSDPLPSSCLNPGRFCLSDGDVFDLAEVAPLRDRRMLESRPAVRRSVSSDWLSALCTAAAVLFHTRAPPLAAESYSQKRF